MAFSAPNCISPSQADSFFKNFKVFRLGNDEETLTPVTAIKNLCNDKDLSVRLAKAVSFMNELNTYQNANSSSIVTREGAGHYFSKRISRILIQPKDSSNCDTGTLAFVYRDEKATMNVCPEALATIDSALLMSWVLVHEARHTEGYGHVLCTHGSYVMMDMDSKGSGSCDDNFETQGSYGVGAGFLYEVARFSKDPVQKQAARSQFVVDLVQRFNELPLDLKSGFIAQNEHGEVTFFDGVKKTSLFNTSPDSFLTSRQDLPTVFDPAGTVKTYYFAKDLVDATGANALEFVGKYTPAERESVRDVYYGNLHDYTCFLYDTKLKCDALGSDQIIEIPLSFQPAQFLMSANSNFVDVNVLYIVAKDGTLYPLPGYWKEFDALVKGGSGGLKPRPTQAPKFISMAGFDDMTEFGVTFDGQLLVLANQKTTWSPLKEYSGERIQKIVAPFLWSSKLTDL